MPNITPLPVPPTRQDPANFNDRADEFLSALEDPFVPELNALRLEVLNAQDDVNTESAAALAAANTAEAAATAAQNYSNAEMWDAGTNYEVGTVAISPTNFQAYRRIVAGTTATDPAADTTNWINMGAVLLEGNQTIAGTKTFSASPIVPTGTAANHAVNKAQLDAAGLPVATTAQAQAGTSDAVVITPLKMRQGFNATGTAPVYACRAWVNFNGTGTVAIRASGNVSSITDNGTGDYTVNFTNALPDVNYIITGTSALTGTTNNTVAENLQNVVKTTSAIRIAVVNTISSAFSDVSVVNIAVFR
jgi:hypothetical protein